MFKEIKNKYFGIINLNVEAKKYLESIEKGDLLDSNFCQKIVENSAKKLGVDFTYGGWLEDRSFLWGGSYLEKTGNFIHLGVDFNVPEETKVFAQYDMEVVHLENDYPLKHGWGQMLIGYVKEDNICILYAHLSKNITWKKGGSIIIGDLIGKVGNNQENGFWFPHLHVQIITKEYFDEVNSKNAWGEFDGYGNHREIESIKKRYIDPNKYIKI